MTLTAEKLRQTLRYEHDTGRFFWRDRPRSDFNTENGFRAWQARCQGREAGSNTGHGYRRICLFNKSYFAHRLAWLYIYGVWPSEHIDHINGIGTDNRIENIRDVSNTDNHRNLRRFTTNTSGVTGVRLDPRYGTWEATIWVLARKRHLGRFKSQEEAIAARSAAERDLGYHPNHGRAA